MGKEINYLREYKEIEAVEKRAENIDSTSFIILLTLAATLPFYPAPSVFIFGPCVFTTLFFKLAAVKKLKGRVRELGFDSFKEFKECVDGARECLEAGIVPDELMYEEQNRIIGDFVKGKKEGKWKDVPEMFKGGEIYIEPLSSERLNGIMKLALSDDDDED